jgi:hypothetical protein
MFKKNLSLIIVIAMLLSMFPTAFAYDTTGFQDSDRAYDVQEEIIELEEHKNPFGAVQAHEEKEKVRSFSVQSLQSSSLPEVDKTTGSSIYGHLYQLSEVIGTRRANTEKEIETKDYIVGAFKDAGYSPEVQSFTYGLKDGSEGNSNNVISTKPGKSVKQIIVGAHYDSVGTNGASDNASGVAVMLGAAEMLKDVTTDYTIKFIAFGAEEVGLRGSKYYVSKMTETEKSNTIAMINLDTVLVGDRMYAYGNLGEKGWVRDQALSLADALDLDVITQQGLNPEYPAGTTGDWSDHAPFKEIGLPWLYFESTNWEETDGLDGSVETVEHGQIMHTGKDNLTFLHEAFPGRIEDRLYTYTTLLSNLLVQINPPISDEMVGINVSTNLLSMSEFREVEVAVNLGYNPDLNNLNWTLGNKPFEDWKSFKSGSYTGEPFISFAIDPYLDGDTVRATIKCDLPYGTSNLQGRPNPRTRYPDLLGEYNLAVTDVTTNAVAKTVMKLNAYDSYHTYDQILPEIERIMDIAKSDRYLEYDPMGKSVEGRDIPFVMFARDKTDLDNYLNDTLPMMLENPALFIEKINDGTAGNYKPAIWFNNIHSDEANGVDAQLDMLEMLATLDEITFDTLNDSEEVITVTLNVQEILDNFILLFNLNNNPDGRFYNTRTTLAGFDPNRDVTYQTQIETAQVFQGLAKWTPMIMNDFHGFVSQFLIEPCTPPHDPNFEFDLLMDGMIEHAHAMGKAGISNTKYNGYIIPMYDYGDGWDDGAPMYAAVLGMMHGALGHTIEIPELNQDSNNAFVYAGIGSLNYALENKENLFKNQLEIYKRGVEGIDDRSVDQWLVNADREIIGRPRGDNENFFPEYYVIPVAKGLQKNPLAAYEIAEYLIKNGVKVETTTTPVTVGDITYPIGSYLVNMHQAKRGLANTLLYDGSDFSDWSAMYAEVTMSFPHLRGFDKYEIRIENAFEGKSHKVNEVNIPTTDIPWQVDQLVIKNTNNDAVKAVNELLAKDKVVQMSYSDGELFNKGDFIVAKIDLDDIKSKYFLEIAPYTENAELKVLEQPKVYAIGTELVYVLEGLGFEVTNSYNDADIIVDASGAINTSMKNLILSGTSYVGIGGGSIYSLENSGLLPGLKRGRTGGSHEGVLRAEIDTDSVITGNYSEIDYLYNKSGSWMETIPATSKVLATLLDSEDFYVAGWWPNHDLAKGKPYIIQDKVGNSTITLFANHITNRAHPSHQFRMLANAIYDGIHEVDEYEFGIQFIDPKLTFKLGGDADVTVELTNNTKETQEATLIVALYDKTNNMMVNYSYISTNIKPGEGNRLTTGFRIPSTGEYNVKAFVWDNWTSARPLSNVLEIGVVK